jgi:hypothetical protein
MGPLVDHFILVEAPFTHVGRPKPLYFEQHKAEIAKLEHADKIMHIVSSVAAPTRDRLTIT